MVIEAGSQAMPQKSSLMKPRSVNLVAKICRPSPRHDPPDAWQPQIVVHSDGVHDGILDVLWFDHGADDLVVPFTAIGRDDLDPSRTRDDAGMAHVMPRPHLDVGIKAGSYHVVPAQHHAIIESWVGGSIHPC